MAKVGKKHLQVKEKFANKQVFSVSEGLSTITENAHVKFDESVDTAIVLGIDPAKGEQTVRGSVLLPHGRGKEVKVLVFAKGENEDVAKQAGADFVGAEDLIEKIETGWTDFDTAVATPDLMAMVGKVARILGPRGLLPNKKVGTVTFELESIIKDLKKGRVTFRNDKSGVLHAPFGRVSFGKEKLKENLAALVKAVSMAKPPSSKGKFIRRLVVSSTMGIGVELRPDELV